MIFSLESERLFCCIFTEQQCNSASNTIFTMQWATAKGPRVFESSSSPTLASQSKPYNFSNKSNIFELKGVGETFPCQKEWANEFY